MQTLSLENAVILDTETTGLDDKAQIVEISAICAVTGSVLFNSLVRPSSWIPSEATAIHGITNSDVSRSPSFVDVILPLFSALSDRDFVIYNNDFDTRLFIQSYELNKQITSKSLRLSYQALKQKFIDSRCAMRWYAEFYGQLDDCRDGYRWQSLVNACNQQNIDVSDLNAHRALADCEMTRRLIHAVNAKIEAR
ncbi:3'-5' exonuclease [Vibrio aestuarianus]|uniref:3'-5' exonuclease n=1 Tax=Vibrio aestuarianus TaxID=28171 RepID=UPI00237D0F07|nr:3'-5' exonuclease [Vibrio aestuarianus]MDE1333348.1 3'-5' exonuclease [Vibrio aestuarianus]